jgi:hypothetical protein
VISSDVAAFFADFETRSNDPAADAASPSQFAEVFLSAYRNAVHAVPRAAFAAALPKRRELFACIGLKRTRLTSIDETPLDDLYVLVATEWTMELEQSDGPKALPFRSTFLLRRTDEGLEIVFYLNHQDVAAVIKELAG